MPLAAGSGAGGGHRGVRHFLVLVRTPRQRQQAHLVLARAGLQAKLRQKSVVRSDKLCVVTALAPDENAEQRNH